MELILWFSKNVISSVVILTPPELVVLRPSNFNFLDPLTVIASKAAFPFPPVRGTLV